MINKSTDYKKTVLNIIKNSAFEKKKNTAENFEKVISYY